MAQAFRLSGGTAARDQPKGFTAAHPAAQFDFVRRWQGRGLRFDLDVLPAWRFSWRFGQNAQNPFRK
jgi:hypothetical protein